MKLSVEFPSIAYREGKDGIVRLAQAIERIGYDEIAVFDHVVMGYPTDTRPAPMYPPQMPILEAVVLLGVLATATDRVSLSTEVLVLPQRQPVLVAKQFSSLDTVSGGRIRLGVGIGWQLAEYEALQEDFSTRGRRMDEAIELMRAYWRDERIDFDGRYYQSTAIAMEPKPPQGGGLPIWVGGTSEAALRRTGRLGDGWMGSSLGSDEATLAAVAAVRRHAEEAGRDPASLGMQVMLAPPPRSEQDKQFYRHHDLIGSRAELLAGMGFDWLSINATAVFQAGHRSLDAMADELERLHGLLRTATGSSPA